MGGAHEDEVVRKVKTKKALFKLLDAVDSGRQEKPDWIYLQADCRLDKLSRPDFERVLGQLHRCVKRGFRARNVDIRGRKKRLAYWSSIARQGFHDFSDFGWTKCYDSPFVENYDYISAYRKQGLEGLDPYRVYSSVLGTFDYSVHDFVNTELCHDVRTILEPMAGTAEFAYHGHFQHPDFRYLMFDLDADAKRHVDAMPWLDGTEREYVVADVLQDEIWERAKSFTTGRSLSYIGKQSHHLFDPKQIFRLLEVGTRHVDYFMLETPQVSLVSDMDTSEDLSRPEMEDAGFEVALVDEPGGTPNPLTNKMAFRLAARNKQSKKGEKGERALFRYPDWIAWQHPILVTLATLLDLNVLYYHSELEEFVPVHDLEKVEDCDCLDNVTFMMFTRHRVPT
ncbi:MAG: hypothetical protein JRH19_05290 [Deltaproteobacteria bacterium]|nr:hypothetical protein [Deltaproteobacteria bacterium]